LDKAKVYSEIAAQVSEGGVFFPTSVRLALRIRDTLAAPDCHIDSVARLVQAEPLLASRIVAMANSVAFNPYGREIDDLRSAISRLGLATVRTLSMAVITRQMAGNALPTQACELAEQLWMHSAHVAALARLLAHRVTRLDPEAAMFAGIVHEVAGFYLLSRSQDYPGILDGDFGEWLDTGEKAVGEPLLRALNVPDNICAAVDTYWNGYLSMPPVSLGDTLLLAEELTPLPSPLHKRGDENLRAQGNGELDMLIGEQLLTEILDESRREVESLTNALIV
jgi:HD-like signal output (HDOD) protein